MFVNTVFVGTVFVGCAVRSSRPRAARESEASRTPGVSLPSSRRASFYVARGFENPIAASSRIDGFSSVTVVRNLISSSVRSGTTGRVPCSAAERARYR